MSFTILVAFPIVVNGFGRVITCSMRNYMYSIKYKAIPLNYFYSGLNNKSGNTCTCTKFVAQMLKHWCKFITQSIISIKTMQVWLTAVSLYADSVSWNIYNLTRSLRIYDQFAETLYWTRRQDFHLHLFQTSKKTEKIWTANYCYQPEENKIYLLLIWCI